MYNPRRANSHRRNLLRDRVARQGKPCALCGQPIDYSLSTTQAVDKHTGAVKKVPHPMRYELDEIIPVSKYWLGGYSNREACALDPRNVQPVHRICNQRKGNKTITSAAEKAQKIVKKAVAKKIKTSRVW